MRPISLGRGPVTAYSWAVNSEGVIGIMASEIEDNISNITHTSHSLLLTRIFAQVQGFQIGQRAHPFTGNGARDELAFSIFVVSWSTEIVCHQTNFSQGCQECYERNILSQAYGTWGLRFAFVATLMYCEHWLQKSPLPISFGSVPMRKFWSIARDSYCKASLQGEVLPGLNCSS